MPTPVTPATNAVPLGFQTSTVNHPASIFRQTLLGVLGGPGVGKTNPSGDFKVTAGTGMNVSIAKGVAFVQGSDISDQGLYGAYLDTDTTLTLDSSSAFDRTDLVIAQVKDKTANGANNDTWVLTSVTGATGGAPPATPVSSYVLAYVSVPNGASAVGSITDRRVAVGGSASGLIGGAHGARLYKSGAAPTPANNTPFVVTFDQEPDDTDSYHNPASNSSRITVPTGLDGVYDLKGSITWVNNNTGYRQIAFLQNGVLFDFAQVDASSGTNGDVTHIAYLGRRAAAGDYFEVQVKQTSGAGLQLNCSVSYNCQFSCWLRGT